MTIHLDRSPKRIRREPLKLPERRLTGEPNAGPLEISVTLEMLRAGVLAYQQWDSDKEETECLVASIFYSMLDAAARQTESLPRRLIALMKSLTGMLGITAYKISEVDNQLPKRNPMDWEDALNELTQQGDVGPSLTLDLRNITPPTQRFKIWLGLANGSFIEKHGSTFDEVLGAVKSALASGQITG
jgi:hypothetical protein